MPLQKESLFVRGERMTAIAIISMDGVLDLLIRAGTTNGEVFHEFTAKYLLPQLQPFNGINRNSACSCNGQLRHPPSSRGYWNDRGSGCHCLLTLQITTPLR